MVWSIPEDSRIVSILLKRSQTKVKNNQAVLALYASHGNASFPIMIYSGRVQNLACPILS